MPAVPLMNQMRAFTGAEDPDAPTPVTPQDYMGADGDGDEASAMPGLAQSQGPDLFNPVTDTPPDGSGYGEGEEPQPLGADVAPEQSVQDPPEGPESEMNGDEREDMYDMLAQRAKARSARSEYFQDKAREMAGKYF